MIHLAAMIVSFVIVCAFFGYIFLLIIGVLAWFIECFKKNEYEDESDEITEAAEKKDF